MCCKQAIQIFWIDPQRCIQQKRFVDTTFYSNHIVLQPRRKKLLRIFMHLFVVIVFSSYDFRNLFLGKVKRKRILLKALYFINIVVTLPSIQYHELFYSDMSLCNNVMQIQMQPTWQNVQFLSYYHEKRIMQHQSIFNTRCIYCRR